MKLGVFSKIFLCVFVTVSVLSCLNFSYVNAQGTGSPAMPGTAGNSGVQGTTNSGTTVPDNNNEDDWLGVSKGIRSALGHSVYGVLSIVNTVLGWVGQIFDTTIKETILQVGDKNHFGENNPNNYNGVVLSIWKIFRDIGNIIIIFSLLYLAIKTILEGDGFADKKTLSSILIAAALINFSLFFTKLAFDVSNTVSVAVYTEIKNGGAYQSSSISEGIMNIVNFQGLMGRLKSDINDWNELFSLIGQSLMFATLCVILGFIFIAASIMLLYRFFMFIVLMMTSPLGLVSRFVPWLSGHGKLWWEQLKKQSIALPTFFIMFYVALYVAGTIFHGMSQSIKNVDIFAQTPTPDALYAISIYIVNFIILVMFLFMALVAPGYVGGIGSNVMSGAGTKLKGWGNNSLKWAKAATGTATLGTGAVLARSTARGGALFSNKTGLTDAVKSRARKEGRGFLGINSLARKTVGAGDYIGNKATYDVRNIKVGGKTIGDQTGLGKGIMGYKAAVDAQKAKVEEQKKREFETLGFDKLKADLGELTEAKRLKEVADKDVTTKQNDLKGIPLTNVAGRAAAAKQLKDALKEQEDANKKYRELEKFGESQYVKLNQSRAKRFYNLVSTRGAGRMKHVTAMSKQWTIDPAKKRQKELIDSIAGLTKTT